MTKHLLAAMTAMLILSGASLHAQSDASAQAKTAAKPRKTRTTKSKKESPEAAAVRELQEKVAAQQAQIDALTQQNSTKDAAVSQAQSTAAAAQSQAAEASSQAQAATAAAQSQAEQVNTLKSTVSDLQTTNAGLAKNVSTTKQELREQIESPAAVHYKGITITPVAFFAAEGVWRQHSVNSDINTPFNSIPLPGANQGHVSELNFSGRQSRLGVLAEGNAGTYKLTGYAEMDFLSSGVTSNDNQSNSYTMRQRQIWGKGETAGGFAITGGQMWSLVTEDAKGTDNRTEKLPNTIDSQYMVGFSWERQPSLRIQQRFGDYKTGAFTLAMALEQAQITNFTASSATSGAVPTNFFFAGNGQNGGLYNAFNGTYANNVAPDLIVKGAWDVPAAHVELGGLARFLRDYYFPAGSPKYVSNTKTAGGVFGSVRVSPSPYVDFGVAAMAGDGTGRYGSAQLADATVHPDGTLEPIRNYHGLLSIETHPTKKLDVFFYYGGEYDQRTSYTTSTGALIGYGPRNLNNGTCYNLATNPGSSTGGSPTNPSGCTSPTRYIQEPMGGFIYRVANSPKYGKLQYWVTYSYFQRNLWSGIGSATTPSGPRATEPMVDVSMRYYIP